MTPATNRQAVECYRRATELDPDYALAWAGLADAYSASPINSDASPDEVAPRARHAAGRAVASGPDLAESQTAFGTVKYWLDWDWPAAETAYRKAIELDYSYSLAHRVLAVVMASSGRHGEARRAMARARELDPSNPMEQALSAHVEFVAGDYGAGLPFARQATAVGPAFWIGWFQLGQKHERLGNNDLALDALKQAEAYSSNSKMLSLRGYILARIGRPKEAEAVLSELRDMKGGRYVPPYAMALVHAGLGQTDQVFAWLDKAVNERDVHVLWLVQDPKWDPFRADPRFLRLLERCNFMRTAPAS